MQTSIPSKRVETEPTAEQLEIRRKLAHLSLPEKQKVLRMVMLAATKHNQEALLALNVLSKPSPP